MAAKSFLSITVKGLVSIAAMLLSVRGVTCWLRCRQPNGLMYKIKTELAFFSLIAFFT